ncbi:efflux RND transporter periplasmic adaptor subunit [Moorella sulfitireducens]|uniref:efflux RND transporter periplasmic adaptor subunit n=1 Tax=Neomoorella sulfitireducens TaxID=2972948 RepID=UPI0021AC43A8|nr:efflux RND transporter periplasmic adaptor subunit [Moorella sulfitireducens]
MKKSVKLVSLIIVIAIVVAYGVFYATRPLQAELIEVKPQTVAQNFKEEGIVEGVLERPVYSLVTGEIINLAVKEGQHVAAGELLAQINTQDMEYQLAQLRAQRKSLAGQEQKSFQEIGLQIKQQQFAIEATKRELLKSEENYKRVQLLYEANAVAKTELEAAENAVKQLQDELASQEAQLEFLMEQTGTGENAFSGNTATGQYFQGLIEAVDAQIKQLEYQIENSRITSPIDGVVQEINARQGMVVSPQVQLMKLTATNGYEINSYLRVEDVLAVKEGTKVTLIQKRKDGDYRFQGTVKSIAPAAVEKISALGLVERRVKVTIQPDGNLPELRPGYALDVEFSVLEQHDKLAVPKTCLFPYEDGEAVWVVRDGRAQIQKIEKGMETDVLVVIEQGLQPGDKVIKNPQLEGLKPGKRVNQAA